VRRGLFNILFNDRGISKGLWTNRTCGWLRTRAGWSRFWTTFCRHAAGWRRVTLAAPAAPHANVFALSRTTMHGALCTTGSMMLRRVRAMAPCGSGWQRVLSDAPAYAGGTIAHGVRCAWLHGDGRSMMIY
jgi:hypothetical protein